MDLLTGKHDFEINRYDEEMAKRNSDGETIIKTISPPEVSESLLIMISQRYDKFPEGEVVPINDEYQVTRNRYTLIVERRNESSIKENN